MSTNVIELQNVFASDETGSLQGLSLSLPAGSTGALLGLPRDGTTCVASVLAGLIRPRRGRALVTNKVLFSSPSVRAKVGVVLASTAFPPAANVEQLFDVAHQLRGGTEADDDWKQVVGLDRLLRVPLRSLTTEQARAVALGLALSVANPLALVLYEPLKNVIGSVTSDGLRAVLERRAQAGAAIVVLTSDVEHARQLTDDVATLQSGRIGRPIGGPDPERLTPGTDAKLLVWTPRPAEFAALVSRDKRITGVSWSGRTAGAPVVLSASEIDVCGAVVADVLQDSEIEVTALRPITPRFDEVTAATNGLLLAQRHMAAYHAAMQHAGHGRRLP